MKCPSCGAPGMKRTFSATHDPERFYLCKECGHTLSRAREPWSDRDQRFFIMARLVEEVRLLEEIRDALKERIPAEGASPISLLQEAASDRTRSKAPCRSIIILVSHRPGTMQIADTVLSVESGRVC